MAMTIFCPFCGETEDLKGVAGDDVISITCGECGQVWDRPATPVCPQCHGTDIQPVPLAIVERSRGTQLSMVGIRIVHLCEVCDADDIARWQANRPSPLLPRELPTVSPTD